MRIAALALCTLVGVRTAHAESACEGETGWSPAPATTLPTHAHLVFRDDRGHAKTPVELVATIDGRPVHVTQKLLASSPWRMVLVEIDSDRTGTLQVAWRTDNEFEQKRLGRASYVVAAGVDFPATTLATTSRYHHELHHSTIVEVWDGLAIAVGAPATRAHVKIRRDAFAPWSELDVPVVNGALHVGALGCTQNYAPGLLERGVDLSVTLALPDGSEIPIDNLSHAAIEPRTPDGQSR